MRREARIRRLKGIIEDAFKAIPYPGDNNIAGADHCDECYDLARAFRGKRWQDITLEFLQKGLLASGLPLFNFAALRYYLPAYMIVSVEHYIEAEAIPGFILNIIVPHSAEPDSFFLESFEPLTSDQKRAVRLFLEYMVDGCPDDWSGDPDDDTPLQGIEKYWGNY